MNESESFGPLVVLIIIFAVGTWFGYAMGKENAPKPVVDLSHRDKISRRPVTKRVNEPDGEGYKKFQEAKKKLIDRKSI